MRGAAQRLELQRLGAAPALALACALLAFAPPSAGQVDGEAPVRGAFGEVVDVRLIDVEVVVTDRQGERVTGLAEADFRLFVDGEETEVAFFDEVRGGALLAEAAAGEEAADGSRSRVAFEEAAGISYLLFLDDYFAHAKDRNRVLDGLLGDLGDLGPDDRLTVLAFDGRRLEALLPWSRDRAAVEAALAAASERPASIAYHEQRRAGDGDGLARIVADQLERTYAAVATALRTHADAPGRRVALVVSGGWPYDAATALLGFGTRHSREWSPSGAIRAVADTANATGFTLYTIDAVSSDRKPEGDVRRESLGRPEDDGFNAAMAAILSRASGGGGESQGGGGGRPPAIGSERRGDAVIAADQAYFLSEDVREFEKESTLLVLAELTGGRAMINSRRRDALARVAADVRDYYWLGFYHQRSGDGAERSLRVEVVGRPDLEVRSRRGFVDLSPSAEARFVTERALLLGETPAGAAELAVELGEAAPAGGRQVELPFRVTVPLAELTLVEAADGTHAKLELQVAVEDDKGRRSELAAIPMDLVLTRGEAAGGELVYDAAVRIRNRPHDLVFTIADTTTGKALVTRVRFVP